MSRSSVDINNPCYEKSAPEVKFDSGLINDVIEGFSVKIEYDYFIHERILRIVSLKVTTNYSDSEMELTIANLIEFVEGRTVELECTMQII